MLEMFNLVYFIWVILFFVTIIGVYFLFRNKSQKFKFWFLFGLSVFMWVNHFARIWLQEDLRTYELFFIDLCGFSTLVYPFFMWLKHKAFKDYMFFIGGYFAFHSILYPNNILGDPVFIYNTIRFWLAHTILVMIPVLLIAWKMHTPSIKNVGWMVIFVLIGAMYNMTISSVHYYTGLTHSLINYMGLWGNTDGVFRLYEILSPYLRFDVMVDGVIVSQPFPFFYMIPALIIVYVPVWSLMVLPFEIVKRRKRKREA
jgi:hypothetical protein